MMTKTKVLLIEDDWDIAQITLLALDLDSRIEARHVEEGDEALRQLKEGGWLPDLVVSDLMMPGLNGLQLLDILQREGLKRMPFVLMTAKVGLREEAAYRKRGADGVLTKPFDPLTLGGQLLSYLEPPRACA
ncbi:response regulator [Sphingomonas oryzagri]|jgi:two-component system OmpR family response regulator|uniref:Response regulator n=1 Tax=Sphingomonas oryzagri TaxID=3042314 RepID=A0ABT6MZA7_9SPHN|nr:response regulator [Sphingomonas oryzagri]MDH7638399.1 response regulator [Sphingomonas oryzagri]